MNIVRFNKKAAEKMNWHFYCQFAFWAFKSALSLRRTAAVAVPKFIEQTMLNSFPILISCEKEQFMFGSSKLKLSLYSTQLLDCGNRIKLNIKIKGLHRQKLLSGKINGELTVSMALHYRSGLIFLSNVMLDHISFSKNSRQTKVNNFITALLNKLIRQRCKRIVLFDAGSSLATRLLPRELSGGYANNSLFIKRHEPSELLN